MLPRYSISFGKSSFGADKVWVYFKWPQNALLCVHFELWKITTREMAACVHVAYLRTELSFALIHLDRYFFQFVLLSFLSFFVVGVVGCCCRCCCCSSVCLCLVLFIYSLAFNFPWLLRAKEKLPSQQSKIVDCLCVHLKGATILLLS